MTIFEPTGPVAVKVTLAGGEVTVQASELPGVEVELAPLRDNEVTRRAIADARVEMIESGGRCEVIVSLGKGSGFTIGRGPEVGVRVRCPRGSDLGVRSSSADLEATGALGSVEAKTASGDVSLEAVDSANLSTASGDVRVRDADQVLSIRTASGNVSVGRCRGSLSINLVSGDLVVAEAAAGFNVATVSGDVEIRAAAGGPMQIGSVSGDVHVAIKPGVSLYVDASSLSGDLSSELELEVAPAIGSEAQVRELSIRTVSGDVQIVRAAVAHA
ncbi:DUF4097 family beta strand repeat-containing protein [Gaiella sp.]|uniref:DUF4097 family beta strand repeat-containing protein n=1 Tax=Gaiella sp. TaxID=2663207 RepID=UPI0039835044